MKPHTLFAIIVVLGFFIASGNTIADPGSTVIAKWKYNKKGAYTLRFDDSMMSHRDHTIPNLIERGLVASFFINPATNRYGYGIDTWESLAGRAGLELCPHTMNHIGAGDLAEADYEIGEAFRTVWELNPPDKSRLYPFNRGGGTSWPTGYRQAIESKYPVANYSEISVRYNGEDDLRQLIAFAEKAMKDDAWHTVLTHGTGPDLEWLGFEVSNFEGLLDYLESVKDKMWIGNAGDIFKYVMERQSANINLLQANQNLIRLELTSEEDPLLFDYPLTLITEVPSDWNYCHVSQGDIRSIHPVASGKVMYNAIPDRGEIKLQKSAMDDTPPSTGVVRDGTDLDIDVAFSTSLVSANWDEAKDEESGISRYWYRIGTTPGGAEVLDWIDNGRMRSFTTSRTNLYLVRGEKYYVTVKAVNGVGLSSENSSDGFQVQTTPDYVSFKENFDNGYLSQWDKRNTRNGSDKNIIYLTDKAARQGDLGLQCHFQEGAEGRPCLVKHHISENNEVFTQFYFKLSSDLQFSSGEGSLRLIELRDGAGEQVATVSIGFNKGSGLHVYASGLDDTGYNASLPGFSGDYPHSLIPVEKDKWIKVDLRTIAHEKKGGTEFWVNGTRVGCITNRFTQNKAARSMRVGILEINGEIYSGEIFVDDIAVSDSYLK